MRVFGASRPAPGPRSSGALGLCSLAGTQLTTLLLALLVLTTATGALRNVDHGTLVTPVHSVDGDVDPDTGDGDLLAGPLPPVQLLSLDVGVPARPLVVEPRRPRGRTEPPPDRPPTRAA